ncbi:hypothetical protein NL676_019682 [Syzygium grande]|nr:hypothetical protein NL676_019682 [Syzygium grande]
MMATLIAIAVTSSSVAIHSFYTHQPSLAPDLGEVERSRPWPPLNLTHGCSTSPSPKSGRRQGRAVAMGEAGIRIGGLYIAAWSLFFGIAFAKSESGARLESA